MDQVTLTALASAIPGVVTIGILVNVHTRLGRLMQRGEADDARGNDHEMRIRNLERNQGSIQCFKS